MRPGFILLEILLASALAAIIGIALLAAFDQLNSSVISIDSTMTVHADAALLLRQMERDVSGAFIPAQEQSDKKSADEKTEKNSAIEKVFYGTSRDGMLELFTFITNNPQQVYWSDTVGQAKPCIARVVYRLEPDKQEMDKKRMSYVLTRQESLSLSFDAFSQAVTNPVRSYPLVRGIKSMRIYFYTNNNDGTASERVDTWGIDEEQSTLPRAIQLECVFWQGRTKRQVSYTYTIPIVAQGFASDEQKKEKASEEKKNGENQAVEIQTAKQPVAKPVVISSNTKKSSMNTVKTLLRGFTR